MSIDAGGFKYFTGRGGVVSPDDPIDTIRAVADAYDIGWLVLERGATVEALRPVLDGRRTAGMDRTAAVHGPVERRRRPGPRPLPRLHRCRRWPVRVRPVTRREAWLTAAAIFGDRPRRPRPRRLADRLPEARGHGLLRRRRAEPARGARARVGRPLELRHAAARLPAPRLRGLAATSDVARRDPDGRPGAHLRGCPGRVGRHRFARPGPRLAPRRGRRGRARASDRPGRGPSRSARA